MADKNGVDLAALFAFAVGADAVAEALCVNCLLTRFDVVAVEVSVDEELEDADPDEATCCSTVLPAIVVVVVTVSDAEVAAVAVTSGSSQDTAGVPFSC